MGIVDEERQILLRIERKAYALQQQNPRLTNEAAIAEAWMQNPRLYDEYVHIRERAKARGLVPLQHQTPRSGQ